MVAAAAERGPEAERRSDDGVGAGGAGGRGARGARGATGRGTLSGRMRRMALAAAKRSASKGMAPDCMRSRTRAARRMERQRTPLVRTISVLLEL